MEGGKTMGVNRREFLLGGGAAGAVLASPSWAGAAEAGAAKKEAALKISSQEGIIPGRSLEEKLDKMEKWGIEGLEIGSAMGREKQLPDLLKDRKVKVSAVCMGSLGGRLVGPDKAAREKAAEAFKRHLTAAGAVGSTGCIHVPCFNGEQKLPNKEVRKILLDLLPEIGEHAAKAGARVLLEPLNRGEAYFLRQLADGASICRDCKSEGVAMMGDFYHMSREETNNMGAFVSAGKYLHHIHLASYSRVLPGQDAGPADAAFTPPPPGLTFVHRGAMAKAPDRYTFIEGFRGLKIIGYHDYCSFECGCRGNRDEEIPKCVAFLREQWELAKI
jgi:sugar phosphate isomerase/epimerase